MRSSRRGALEVWARFTARDTHLDRTVAIKILPAHLSDDPEAKQRFEREARTISSLNHPHICVLHDVGSQDGTAYLVMEYVQGESLESRLQKGPLPLKQALECGSALCGERSGRQAHLSAWNPPATSPRTASALSSPPTRKASPLRSFWSRTGRPTSRNSLPVPVLKL